MQQEYLRIKNNNYSLPFSLFEAGIILGTIILVIVCAISVIASMFIIETLAIQNAFLKEERSVLLRANTSYSKLSDDNYL